MSEETSGDLLQQGQQLPATPPEPKALTKARVLTACAYGQPNTVVQLTKAELKAAEADGLVDSTKAAVAYAESLAVAQA